MILVVKTIDARYSKFLSLPTKANYSQTSSLAQTKKSKILNTVLKPKITYSYYTACSPNPTSKKIKQNTQQTNQRNLQHAQKHNQHPHPPQE